MAQMQLWSRLEVQVGGIAIALCSIATMIHQSTFPSLLTIIWHSLRFSFVSLFFIPLAIPSYSWKTLVVLAFIYLCISQVAAYAQIRRKRAAIARYEESEGIYMNLAFDSDTVNFFSKSQETNAIPFVFPESEVVEQELNELINLVLLQYVHSWYVNISGRELVPHLIERIVREALIAFKSRLTAMDLIGTMVRRSIPIITKHLHEVSVAEAQVRETIRPVHIDALEHNSICEQFARNLPEGELHLAAQIAEQEESSGKQHEDKLHVYLRQVVAKLLPALLPSSELGNHIFLTMVREVVACAVLTPLMNLLSDPEFWNQIIVTHAHQAIQERARVKRFRHVLKQQISDPKRTMKRKPMKNLERLMLSNDSKDWERLYRKIKKSQSLADVSRMRSEMMILKNEMLAATTSSEETARLSNQPMTKSNNDAWVIKAMNLLEARISKLSGNDRSVSSTNLSFDMTLAVGVAYMFDFMRKRNRAILLEFWQYVIHVKLNTSEPMPSSQLLVLDSNVLLSRREILHVYNNYFDSPLLTITEDEKFLVKNYVRIEENDVNDVDGHTNEIVMSIARRAYRTMETDDFPAFKVDRLYFDMITGVEDRSDRSFLIRSASTMTMPARSSRLESDARASLDLPEVDLAREYLASETISMLDATEKDVLEALGDALQQSENNEHSRATYKDEATPLSPVPTSSPRMPGLGQVFKQDPAIVRLDAPSHLETPILDLRTAEPGDLGVIEQIDLLEKEITKRKASLRFIESFLKREIDDTDRRTAEKSRKETTRELDALLTQKQQFVMDDHSLFGRSSVRIDHTTTQKDPDGTDFTTYVIEVRRTGPDGIEAGWIITRRYSQFNELQAQLKQHFPYVSSFDFPKKQLNRLKSVADARRPILESFLRKLLQDEQICKSRQLRAFLSQSNDNVKKRQHKGFVEGFLGLTDPREAFGRLVSLLEGPEESFVKSDNPDLRDVHPPPHDQHDDELSSFAKPIVDLILEAFDLRERSKWIRKRAVVLVLQQLLGGTIESRVRDHVAGIMEPKSFSQTLRSLKHSLLLHDTAEGLGRVKTKAEKERLMDLAWETLRAYNPSYVPETAAKKVFRTLQIRSLNMHLLGKLMDSFVELF